MKDSLIRQAKIDILEHIRRLQAEEELARQEKQARMSEWIERKREEEEQKRMEKWRKEELGRLQK